MRNDLAVSNWCEYAALSMSSPRPIQLCRYGIQANFGRTDKSGKTIVNSDALG
jgi:hypothetical protein